MGSPDLDPSFFARPCLCGFGGDEAQNHAALMPRALATMSPKQESEPVSGPLLVDASEAGLRVDAFLVGRKVLPSASAARRAVAAATVRVNGRLAKKGARLEPGDTVDLGGDLVDKPVLVPLPHLPLAVLYQDGDMVAVDKPALVPSHPLRPGEGATVAAALVARFPECALASPDPREGGLAHRLDVATSGVLLAARSREFWYRLRHALAEPSCEKLYLAEIRGAWPSPERATEDFVLPGPHPRSFVVTAPIGRRGRRGDRVKLASGREPLLARTEMTLLEARGDLALVEARLSRGRPHQVRAHLAYLGTPVRGDPIYGEAVADRGLGLHAWAVSFLHPAARRPLRIEAPPPPWAQAYSNWAMLVSTRR
jgi:23S rRNA pseudouridine1911/1915/1917 synthase